MPMIEYIEPSDAQRYQRQYAWTKAQLICAHGIIERAVRDFGIGDEHRFELSHALHDLQLSYRMNKPKNSGRRQKK